MSLLSPSFSDVPLGKMLLKIIWTGLVLNRLIKHVTGKKYEENLIISVTIVKNFHKFF